jgi:ribosome modulation factor
MKRQKRNQTDRAMARGYQAGIAGKSRNLCPHETGEARHVWLTGWREARQDLWNGYNTAAQMQRLHNL